MFGKRRDRFLAGYVFPPGFEERLAAHRPGLGAAGRELVMEGLRDWFRICRASGRRFLAMPSQAVDDAWHELILYTREYEALCRSGIGHFLHHTPAPAVTGRMDTDFAMERTFRGACELEGIDPARPDRLPRIFAIDEQLGIEDGFRFVPFPDGIRPFEMLRPERTPTGVAWVAVPAGAAFASGCAGGANGCGTPGAGGSGDGSDGGGGCGGGGCGGGG
ncbi:MAG: hypothetical protein AB7V62_02995 [Thermoleophilia bacterium]